MNPTSNIMNMLQGREEGQRNVRLVCRKGFGYVLVAEDPGTVYIKPGTVLIFMSADWEKMKVKVAQAEALFECQCEYEGNDNEDH
jgi:hypothetical protein